MKIIYHILFYSKKFLLFIFILQVFSISISFSQEYIPNEIIIKIKSQSSISLKKITEQLKSFNNQFGIYTIDSLNKKYNIEKIKSLFPDNKLISLKKEVISNFPDGIYVIRFNNLTNINDVVLDYGASPDIEYAQLNYIYRIHNNNSEPVSDEQWGLKKIYADKAWQIETGSKDVLISIIDTGIDYLHQDLRENIWINSGEDINKNGIVDSSDFNGIDDDGNGFIDDIMGWDFTDVPSYPDDGDYLNPDSDPMDENGHGTSIAGIIAGTGSNGVYGVAPGCRIMNLRCATSKGFLQDDDIASAVIYAVMNGARIINMSFGDFIYSKVLKDIIEFAYGNNCVVITSSGNNGDDRPTYPAGFDKIISVGATNQDDSLAQFSSFGNSLDVTAPGSNIYATKIGNNYGYISGTSASAGFVSGLAGLIISHNKNLFSSQVSSIISLSSDDLGIFGYDYKFGAGRINVLKALQMETFSIAKLFTPDISLQRNEVDVIGTAAGLNMKSYSLFYGVGKNPEKWEFLQRDIKRQVVEDKFCSWNIVSLTDSVYSLRLVVGNYDNSIIEDRIILNINRSIPKVNNFLILDIIDKDKNCLFIRFETDEPTRAKVFYRMSGSNEKFKFIESEYAVKFHKMIVPASEINGNIEFYLEIVNEMGIRNNYNNNGNNFTYNNRIYNFSKWEMIKKDYELPSSYLMSNVMDFDNDNKKEIITNVYENDFSYGYLRIFEYDDNSFKSISIPDFRVIPRDAGDFDGDGKSEILCGFGAKSIIIEAEEENEYPSKKVWESQEGFWGCKFYDINNDGKKELIGRIENNFVSLKNTGDDSYTLEFTFINPTKGSNGVGIPRAEICDFDNDGKMEILLGDSDGDIYIYEYDGSGSYKYIWSYKLEQIDAIDFISSGDFDGDGKKEFIAGCHSEDYPSENSDPKIRYWHYMIFGSRGDNDFYYVGYFNILGYNPINIFDSGCFTGDIDNDGKMEIVVSSYPNLYVIEYSVGRYEVSWYYDKCRSSRFVIDDVDGNGYNELLFNDGDKIISFEERSNILEPKPPFYATAVPIDTDKIQISWKCKGSFDYFIIYRGNDKNNLVEIKKVSDSFYIDTNLEKNKVYWYAVSSFKSGFKPSESQKSNIVYAKPNEKPFIKNVEFILNNNIKVIFSEPMSKEIIDESNYKIYPESFNVSSAAYSKSGDEVLLTVTPDFIESGYYRLEVSKNLKDVDSTPIDTSSLIDSFYVAVEPVFPYITEVNAGSDNSIILTFNIPMEKSSVMIKENFIVEPKLEIKEIMFFEDNPYEITLKIDKEFLIGALGKNYKISVKNLKSINGKETIDGKGNSISLVLNKDNLSEVFIYPNPYNSLTGKGYVTFANLTERAKIWIMDISGKLIKKIEETDGNGGVDWFLDNENGVKVPSGIYLYYIEGNGGSVKGKLAIIR
jgi:subtilisin family serine protease